MSRSIFEKVSLGKNLPELDRKSQILSEAAEIFARVGFTATVDQVAEKMGVTKGHIYYYFNSKQEILYQIFRQAMDFFMEGIEEANESIFPVDLRLKAVLKSHITAICDNKAVMTVFMDLRKDLREESWKEIVASRKNYEKLIQDMIKEGIDEGYFIEENEKLLSYTILGSINWVYVWYQETGEVGKEKVAEIMSSYLVNGLRKGNNFNTYNPGKSIEDIAINDKASLSKTISEADVYFFSGITGDYNPIYIESQDNQPAKKRIVPEGIITSLVNPVINNLLPGVGTIIREKSYKLKNAVYPEDTITASAIVSEKNEEANRVKLKIKWVNQKGEVVAEGYATVEPPCSKYKLPYQV